MSQDPTSRIAPQVMPHVHLVADFPYPLIAQTNQQFILDELQKAPRVADNTTFSWQFLDAPQDGTVLLVYHPPQRPNVWGTDGYTWLPEQFLRQQYGPFIVEMYQSINGYNTTYEPRAGPAVHCRQRYRLIPDPNSPTKHGNPSLWLVHYKRSERMEQANRIPQSQQDAIMIQARNYLKSLGHLQEKKFMLGDAMNWPAVTLPEVAAHHGALTFTGGQMAHRMHAAQQQAYNRDHGPSPKRPRHGNNASQRPVPVPPPVQQVVIDEEDPAESDRRDEFDMLTQTEISVMRFKNHEEWMEELFSGYNTFDIKPVDLQLGRAGFMQPITDGFFSKPDRLPTPPLEVSRKPDEHYTNITAKPFEAGKTKQFAQAVEKRIAENNAQIAEMKRIHEQHIKNLSMGITLREAATRIRGEQQHNRQKAKSGDDNTSGNNENKPGTTASTNEAESIDEVTKHIQSLLGKQIVVRHDVNLFQKGGLVEKTPAKTKPNVGNNDQMAALFDDFLEPGDSAEVSNKPSVSPPLPVAQEETTSKEEAQADDWVMVPNPSDQDSARPQVSESGNGTALPMDDIGDDLIDFNAIPGVDGAEDNHDNPDGNAFDDAMHFDTLDTVAGATPGFDGGDAAGINMDGNTATMASAVESTVQQQNPFLEAPNTGPPSAHDTPDVAMDLMDESAFGDAFHHNEAEADIAPGTGNE